MGYEECPVCKIKNEVELWENGKCINCGNKFWWEKFWNEGYEEEMIRFKWEKYSK
jgi:hypothetical protein